MDNDIEVIFEKQVIKILCQVKEYKQIAEVYEKANKID